MSGIATKKGAGPVRVHAPHLPRPAPVHAAGALLPLAVPPTSVGLLRGLPPDEPGGLEGVHQQGQLHHLHVRVRRRAVRPAEHRGYVWGLLYVLLRPSASKCAQTINQKVCSHRQPQRYLCADLVQDFFLAAFIGHKVHTTGSLSFLPGFRVG